MQERQEHQLEQLHDHIKALEEQKQVCYSVSMFLNLVHHKNAHPEPSTPVNTPEKGLL
jgi:hypothetical protein